MADVITHPATENNFSDVEYNAFFISLKVGWEMCLQNNYIAQASVGTKLLHSISNISVTKKL